MTPIEVLMKPHKTPMKPYEQLVAGVLTQVLDDIEDERVKQGKKRIVLNSTLPYANIVQDISQVWDKKYPSYGMSLAYGIRET